MPNINPLTIPMCRVICAISAVTEGLRVDIRAISGMSDVAFSHAIVRLNEVKMIKIRYVHPLKPRLYSLTPIGAGKFAEARDKLDLFIAKKAKI